MPNDFNQQIIDEFRANGGRVGGWFEGARLLLLTTTGARSGNPHTTPVGYLPDGGERVLVIASAGGAPRHPAWYHNLVANQKVFVEDGAFSYEAHATVLNGVERDRIFARAVESDQGWADYQAKTTRVLPVIALAPESDGPPAGSLSAMITQTHDAFRCEISLLRKELAESGPGLGSQLRVNCLTLCHGLHNHHTGEDTAIFPFLADRWPELTPAIERLRAEHEKLATLLAELQELVSGGHTDELLPRFDRLAADLEEHLRYEEEQLLPILDVG